MDMRQFASDFLKEFGQLPFGDPVTIAAAALEGDKDAVIAALIDLLRKAGEQQKKIALEADVALFFTKTRLDAAIEERDALNEIVVNGLQKIRAGAQ